MEIRVAGADLLDTMFSHEDGGMSIMEEISPWVGHLGEDLPRNLSVSWRRHQDTEPERGEQSCHELP